VATALDDEIKRQRIAQSLLESAGGYGPDDTSSMEPIAAESVTDSEPSSKPDIPKPVEEHYGDWKKWPSAEPVEVVMEGLEEPLCFPSGTPRLDTKWKCLLDPIDGTRGIMYDKRSAWALSGVAPQRGEATRLSDIVVAAMTELPTRKQWRADQLSAMRGGGLVASAMNVMDGVASPVSLAPGWPVWLALPRRSPRPWAS
jgi:hypothetical protein